MRHPGGLRRRSLMAIAVVGVFIVAAGCSAPGREAADATPSATVSVADQPAVTATALPTSGTDAVPTAGPLLWNQVPYAFRGSPFNQPLNGDGTMGSGCTLAVGDSPPDGLWAGIVTAGWGSPTITFEVACWYGPASSQAREAYKQCEDVAEYECGGVDYFLYTSDKARTWTLPVYPGAHFVRHDYIQAPWSDVLADPDFERLRDDIYGRQGMPVWIYVNGGRVTQVYQEHGFCCLP